MIKRSLLATTCLLTSLMACGLWASDTPTVLCAKAPYYPAIPFIGRVSGNVNVTVELSKEGYVQEILANDGHFALQPDSAKDARQWKFEPGEAGRTATITFIYRALPIDAEESEEGFYFYPPASVEIRRILPEPVIQYKADEERIEEMTNSDRERQ